MRIDKIGLVVVWLIFLASCSLGGAYSHATKNAADLQRDVDACNEYARRTFTGWAFSEYTALIDDCLARHYGWRKLDKAEAEAQRKLDAALKEALEAAKQPKKTGQE